MKKILLDCWKRYLSVSIARSQLTAIQTAQAVLIAKARQAIAAWTWKPPKAKAKKGRVARSNARAKAGAYFNSQLEEVTVAYYSNKDSFPDCEKPIKGAPQWKRNVAHARSRFCDMVTRSKPAAGGAFSFAQAAKAGGKNPALTQVRAEIDAVFATAKVTAKQRQTEILAAIIAALNA
jgi:hypothetical protein